MAGAHLYRDERKIGGYEVVFFFYAPEQNTKTKHDSSEPCTSSVFFPTAYKNSFPKPSARRLSAHLSRPGVSCACGIRKRPGSMADRIAALDVVDVELLAFVVAVVAVVAVLVELEANALVALIAVCVCFVDLCVLGEFTVGF